MKVLMFGAGGFIGQHLRSRLSVDKYEVIAPRRSDLDLRNLRAVEKLIADLRPHWVFNLAANGVLADHFSEADARKINVEMPLAALEACDKSSVSRFIHFGSCFEYGNSQSDLAETSPLRPSTPYAESKAKGSTMLLSFQAKFCQLSVIRPFQVWGPGEHPSRLFPRLLKAARGKEILNLTPGQQERDFIYVKDLCRLAILVAALEEPPKVLNLGSGEAMTIAEFAAQVNRAIGNAADLRLGQIPYREGEMMRLISDVTLLKNTFPNFSSLPFFRALNDALFGLEMHS